MAAKGNTCGHRSRPSVAWVGSDKLHSRWQSRVASKVQGNKGSKCQRWEGYEEVKMAGALSIACQYGPDHEDVESGIGIEES